MADDSTSSENTVFITSIINDFVKGMVNDILLEKNNIFHLNLFNFL
jgi:hypothetical protein